MSEQPKVKLVDRIREFDRQVREKDFEAAITTFAAILPILEGGKEGFGGSLVATNPSAEAEATILAAAITSLLADKDFKMTDRSFRVFTGFKRAVMQIFEVSGYRGTSHLAEAIGTRNANGTTSFQGFELPKLFSGLSINALTPALCELLKRQKPTMTWPLTIGFLSEQLLWNPQAEEARSEMLTWGELWKDMDANIGTIRNIGPAFMGCSYADAPHKHDIKHWMNHLVRHALEKRGVTDSDLKTPRRPVRRRPTVLVMAELYHSKHAMHRCYGPSIAALKDRFKTVYMSPEGKCDEEVAKMFDKVDNTKFDATKPEVFLNKCKSYRPDILYLPSIGMRLVSIMTSNVRIAPIQIFTPGHPATSRSPFMDYVVLMDGTMGDPACFSEKILLRESKPYFMMRQDAVDIEPKIASRPQPVRLAVPAWSRKVTPRFIKTCQEIAKKAKRPVEFWFFPNGTGALHQAARRRIMSQLNAKVLPRTNYNDYISNLNRCDIYLSTFPFGSTNGIVDGAGCGLPIVNMKGPEVHTMNDSDMLKLIDQPDWLNAETEKEYIAATLRLIENDEERRAISQAILSSKPLDKFMSIDEGEMKDFADIFEQVYKHHEALQEGKDQVLTYRSLMAMK